MLFAKRLGGGRSIAAIRDQANRVIISGAMVLFDAITTIRITASLSAAMGEWLFNGIRHHGSPWLRCGVAHSLCYQAKDRASVESTPQV
jgi:hypothetical protein